MPKWKYFSYNPLSHLINSSVNEIILPDLHIHTAMSADATDDAEEYVNRAIELGIPVIGISDHFDFNPIDRSFGCYDYEKARNTVGELRAKYNGVIKILLGVEITYESPFHDDIVAGLDGKDFDYVIGSIHYVDGVMASERSSISEYEKRDTADAYGVYFREMLRMLDSGLVDIVGHFDLCKRYGIEVYGPFSEDQVPDNLIEKCLRTMIDKNIALEINSSGYRQSPNEPYPGEAIIRSYLNMGGRRITTGSDAHDISRTGSGLSEIGSLLERLGIEEVFIYKNRQPILFNIG